MSLKCIVPDIDTNLQYRDVLLKCGSAVNYRQWVSTSYSNVNTTFSCPPPSQSMFISRLITINLPFSADITCSGPPQGASVCIPKGYFSLRAYPLDSILSSLTMVLNNMSFTLQNSEIIPYMARFWKHKDMQSFPSFMDTYANYSDGVGSLNNPLSSYVDNVYPDSVLRGAYPLTITNLSGTNATVSGNIVCPIFLPVLMHDDNNSLGFTNIKTADYTFNWSSNLSRMFSSALGNLLTNISVTLGQPSLYIRYTSPPAGYVPRTLQYGSHDINRFITPVPLTSMSLSSNPTVTFTSTNIQLNCVPAYIIVFCRESNNNLTVNSSDTAMNISNVSINFDNISGVLSSASEESLWGMSKSNGLQITYTQWKGVSPSFAAGNQICTTGSYLKLVFGKDIMLAMNAHLGKVGSFNLSLTITVNACNYNPVLNPMLYILTVAPSKIIIHEDGLIEQILGIQDNSTANYIPYNKVGHQFFGAGFTDWVKKVGQFIHPINNFLKETKVLSSVASNFPQTKMIGNLLDKLGYGVEDGEDGGIVVGGNGGKVASRAELLRRISKLK